MPKDIFIPWNFRISLEVSNFLIIWRSSAQYMFPNFAIDRYSIEVGAIRSEGVPVVISD